MSDDLSPDFRIIEATPDRDNYIVYSAIRGAMEDIGIDIDDASEKKGFIKGIYLGNKKQPFKAAFKQEKNGSFKIKIDHKFKISLKNFKRRDIRDLSETDYKEVLILKFWDTIYKELGMGLSPDYKKKTMALEESSQQADLRFKFQKKIKRLFDGNPKLYQMIKEINEDQDVIKKKYRWELLKLKQKSRWPKELVYAIEIFLDEKHTKDRTIVLTVSSLDMKTVTKVPIEIDCFITMPRHMPKELNMSYKCQWTSPASQMDDVSQSITHYLNFEMPSVEKQLRNILSYEHTYHFVFNETFNDKGKRTKITHDQIMLEPINIMEVDDPTSENSTFLMVFKYFLRINRSGLYEGFIPLYETIDTLSLLFKMLSRFFVKTEVDIQREKAKEELKKKTSQSSSSLKRCIKCGWLLSGQNKKCPMCGTAVSNEEKTTFGVVSSSYNKSSAVLNAKEKAYSEKLLSNFDKVLDGWGDAKSKICSAVKDSFITLIERPEISNDAIEIIENDEDIKNIVGKAYDANKMVYAGNSEVFGRFLISLSGKEMKFVYVILELITSSNDEIYPILVTYSVFTEYNHHRFSYVRYKAKKRKEADKYLWEVDSGKDPEIVIALNKSSEDFNKILSDIYRTSHTTQYIEPVLDNKGRIKGTKLAIDLYPIIRVEPLIEPNSSAKNIFILRQFLDYKQSGFISVPKVFAVLETIYSIIDIFKENYKKDGSEGENFDYSLIDEKIQSSKYTYKAMATSNSNELPEQQEIQINETTEMKTQDTSELLDQNEEEDDELANLLGSSSDADQDKDEEEDIKMKTTFITEVPANYLIDENLTPQEINNFVYQLQTEINSIMMLAENEIQSFMNRQESYEICQSQIDNFILQIKSKQALIRAYEFENFRIKT